MMPARAPIPAEHGLPGFDVNAESRLEPGSSPAGNTVDSEAAAQAPASVWNWTGLVNRIRAGEDSGMAELYSLFSKGIRYHLCRHLGSEELDDKVHDTFLVVIQAIQRGELREPERLMGFVRTIVRRQMAAYIGRVSHNRRDMLDLDSGVRIADPGQSPEEAAMFRQRTNMIRRVLAELSLRDREILTRFYLREQPQEQICQEMELTETQFRLLKSRAKARFGELGKKRLTRRIMGRSGLLGLRERVRRLAESR